MGILEAESPERATHSAALELAGPLGQRALTIDSIRVSTLAAELRALAAIDVDELSPDQHAVYVRRLTLTRQAYQLAHIEETCALQDEK